MGDLTKHEIAEVLAAGGLDPAGGKVLKAETFQDGDQAAYKVVVDYGVKGVKKVVVTQHDLDVAAGNVQPGLESLPLATLREIAQQMGVGPEHGRGGRVQLILAIRAKLRADAEAELAGATDEIADALKQIDDDQEPKPDEPEGEAQDGGPSDSEPAIPEAFAKDVGKAMEAAKVETFGELAAKSDEELLASGVAKKWLRAVRGAQKAIEAGK